MRDAHSRVALVMNGDDHPGRPLVELAQRAEELGYDTLWVGETWARDAFVVLTELALATSRIRLGTSVISLWSRTPGMLAQSIASLDEVSGGRAILGLGPSSRNLAEGWHGARFERPVAHMRELVPLLRRILSGERVDFEGEFYRMQGLRLPFPAPQGQVPIYFGAISERHLELTGELADGWLPTFFSETHFDTLRAPIERGAQRAGRSLDAVTLAPWVMACPLPDREQARSLARAHIAFFVAAYGDAYNALVRRYGFEEEALRLLELWQTDRSRLASGVSDALLDALAITGTPEQCRERFYALHDQGVDMPAVLPPSRSSLSELHTTIEAMAPGR